MDGRRELLEITGRKKLDAATKLSKSTLARRSLSCTTKFRHLLARPASFFAKTQKAPASASDVSWRNVLPWLSTHMPYRYTSKVVPSSLQPTSCTVRSCQPRSKNIVATTRFSSAESKAVLHIAPQERLRTSTMWLVIRKTASEHMQLFSRKRYRKPAIRAS